MSEPISQPAAAPNAPGEDQVRGPDAAAPLPVAPLELEDAVPVAAPDEPLIEDLPIPAWADTPLARSHAPA